MRIVHLLDPAYCGDEGVLACAATLGIPRTSQSVWIIGDSAAEQRAWALGIPSTDRVNPRRDWRGRLDPLACAKGVRRLAAARFGEAGAPDIVCCWSVQGLALARAAIGRRRPWRVGVMTRPPIGDVDSGPLGRIAAYGLHDATVVALGRRIADAYGHAASVRRGGILLRDNIREIEPPVFPHGGIADFDRAQTRARLGLEHNDVVLGMLADPPETGDAMRLIFNVGLLYTMGQQLVGLAPRGVRNHRRAARFVRAHGRRWGLCIADAPITEIIVASDVCLIDAVPMHHGIVASVGPTAMSLAMAMGVPTVAMPRAMLHTAEEFPPPVPLAGSDDPNRIAVPVLRLLEDSAARNDLAAAQRSWCDRTRARDGFRTTLAAIFREVANVPEARAGLPMPSAFVGVGA